MMDLEGLKHRKLVQWAVAYVAGAWVVLQLLDVVADPWGIGDAFLLAVQITLAFGFCATLVLAWYHGERGHQRLSGAELLMLAALLVTAGAAMSVVRGTDRTPEEDARAATTSGAESRLPALGPDSIPERSIAVLPLENQSPAPEHAYFAPALTDEITGALANIPDLRVTSYSSASQYPGSGMTIREFALQKLGVAHVLEGSVQRIADQVRIRVQLIDARTDEHIWAETYQRALTDVFAVQVEIARTVADRLAASFTERELERIEAGATDDPVAYELYLRARAARDEPPEDRIPLVRRALERDPAFGLAWLELGIAFMQRAPEEGPEWVDSARVAWNRGVEVIDDPAFRLTLRADAAAWFDADLERSIELIQEALSVNPNLIWALTQAAAVHEVGGDLTSAEPLRRRAAALDPLDVEVWRNLGDLYRNVGLDERAEHAYRRAVDADPTAAGPWLEFVQLRVMQGRYPEALAAADSMEKRGEAFLSRLYRGWAYLWASDADRAADGLASVTDSAEFEERGTWRTADWLVQAQLLRGDTAEAYQLLATADRYSRERMAQHIDVYDRTDILFDAMQFASLRGDTEAAVTFLRDYVEAGGRSSRWIRLDPMLSGARDDPDFQAELARLEAIVERQREQIERDLAAAR